MAPAWPLLSRYDGPLHWQEWAWALARAQAQRDPARRRLQLRSRTDCPTRAGRRPAVRYARAHWHCTLAAGLPAWPAPVDLGGQAGECALIRSTACPGRASWRMVPVPLPGFGQLVVGYDPQRELSEAAAARLRDAAAGGLLLFREPAAPLTPIQLVELGKRLGAGGQVEDMWETQMEPERIMGSCPQVYDPTPVPLKHVSALVQSPRPCSHAVAA